MSDQPPELDLKFLPDWLKEGAKPNRYAEYEGESERPFREGRGGGPPRGDRGPRGDRRDGPRPARTDDRRRPGGGGPPRGGKPGGSSQGNRRDDRRPQQNDRRPAPPPPPPAPMVRIEFVPEPNCVTTIGKQIKSSGRAYPLFGTARLFLEKPERHRVRVTSLDPAVPLFQVGDGPLSFDRTLVERNAFRELNADYYREEVVQGEPLKGNFTSVARVRSTGTLLGPTSYHGYQPALRRIFEERFSRRMSFSEFQHEEIETISGEQAVNDWKEQARSSTTYTTLQEPEPITFKSLADAEQHFRKHYLPGLVKSGVTLETSGHASRAGDRQISATLRDAWEHERGFPANIVNHLRPHFLQVGLHFFKHRKRILYISPIRPQRHAAGQIFSDGISAILGAIEAAPKCTRPQLAATLLGPALETPEALPRKAALAGDLHYLIHAGHVIEFHDGTLDLPLTARAESEQGAGDSPVRREPQRPERAGAGSNKRPSPREPSPVSALSPMPTENITSSSLVGSEGATSLHGEVGSSAADVIADVIPTAALSDSDALVSSTPENAVLSAQVESAGATEAGLDAASLVDLATRDLITEPAASLVGDPAPTETPVLMATDQREPAAAAPVAESLTAPDAEPPAAS